MITFNLNTFLSLFLMYSMLSSYDLYFCPRWTAVQCVFTKCDSIKMLFAAASQRSQRLSAEENMWVIFYSSSLISADWDESGQSEHGGTAGKKKKKNKNQPGRHRSVFIERLIDWQRWTCFANRLKGLCDLEPAHWLCLGLGLCFCVQGVESWTSSTGQPGSMMDGFYWLTSIQKSMNIYDAQAMGAAKRTHSEVHFKLKL